MTAEQALAAARIIRDVAASHEGWNQRYGYYPLAEALEEYAEMMGNIDDLGNLTPKVDRCGWKYNDSGHGDCWETTCGESIHLTSGTPQEIGLRFCPFCNCKIEQSGKGVKNEA